MKKAAIISVMALFSVMLASCDLFPDFSLKEDDNPLPDTLEDGYFYAQNLENNKFYVVKAEELYEGEKCVIWAEEGSGVTQEMAEIIACEYDTNIRPMVVETFSKEYSDGIDILDYANWLADRNDRKLTILLLDIQDGYKDPKTDSYTAGYFWSGNFWPKGKFTSNRRVYYSNSRDMIYVDTDPGLTLQITQAFSTFAHELQHLVNYVTCYRLSKGNTDTWINEGLSAFAEYLYLGENPADKCVWLRDSRNTINTGNNFFVWGNHKDKPLAILDDYATVYFFFRWLYLQADAELQSHIFRDIAHSEFSDYHAVTSVAAQINLAWSDWETLLRTWLAANYYPQNQYGYTGDDELQRIIKIDPISNANISLYPGEGVYSILNNSFNPAVSGTNIRYAGLVNTGDINASSPYSGNVLLTFNANESNSAGTEKGYLTGVAASATVSRAAAENSQPKKWNGPYVIDAGDLLGRDWDKLNHLPR